MAKEVEKVILFPRYTTILGMGDFTTAPIQVREFESAAMAYWRGKVILGGGSPTISARMEESPDLDQWFTITGSSVTLTEGTEVAGSAEFTMDWARLVITVSDSPAAAVTFWALGNFDRRHK